MRLEIFLAMPPVQIQFPSHGDGKIQPTKKKKKPTNNKMTISPQGNSRVNDDGKYGNVLKLLEFSSYNK